MNNLLSQTWVMILGAVFGGMTLLFLMALVFTTMFLQLPCSSRFLVISVVSIGAALSAAFMGGNAVANGNLPIPGVGATPLAVSIGGGVAVLVIMFLLTSALYPEAACGATP